jgi:hypothetical protein
VLTDTGDGKTFTSTHTNWVDMGSGRVHNEEVWVQFQQLLNPESPHGYAIVVKSDGTELTMRGPFEESGGDYEVLWDEGRVVFFASQAGKTVTASYSYSTTSIFYLHPLPGKVWVIEDAETDISLDTIMTDDIVYGVWDGLEGEKTCKGAYTFKRAAQVVTEARGSYAPLSAIGATAEALLISDIKEFRRKSRGMWSGRQSLPFQYATVRHLYSSKGDELRVFTKQGRAFGGEHTTMTFYCTEKDE